MIEYNYKHCFYYQIMALFKYFSFGIVSMLSFSGICSRSNKHSWGCWWELQRWWWSRGKLSRIWRCKLQLQEVHQCQQLGRIPGTEFLLMIHLSLRYIGCSLFQRWRMVDRLEGVQDFLRLRSLCSLYLAMYSLLVRMKLRHR